MASLPQKKSKSKGGRPPKSGEGALTKTMAFRLRPTLEQRLRESALIEGRSISEEVEARLNRSVQNDAMITECFGSPDQRELLTAISNAVRFSDHRSDGPNSDNKMQGYAAAIAIVQGLAGGVSAAEILRRASDTGHGWIKVAASVLALERKIGEPEAAEMVEGRDPQKLRPAAGGKPGELVDRPLGDIMGR